MPRLVDEFNAAWSATEWHQLVLIADFIMWFLAIHPFEDGNGRLARALTTLLLLRADHDYVPYASLESVIEDNKPRYYLSLHNSQIAARTVTDNYGEWLAFFLRALEVQQSVLQAKVEHITRRQALPEIRARVLEFITEHGPLTAPAIGAELRMPERTVRYHLRLLTAEGLLEATSPTAGRLYSLPVGSVRPPTLIDATESIPQRDESSAVSASEALTPLDFDPMFQRHSMAAPNGRVYATVVIGASSPNNAPLGDAALDAFEHFARTLAPAATPSRAAPEVGWWRVEEERLADRLQLWLYPGPLVIVHWALDPPTLPSEAKLAIGVRVLLSYWRAVLTTVRDLLLSLDVTSCAVSLSLTTYPAGRPYPVGFDFGDFPVPLRSGGPTTPPDWHSAWAHTAVASITEDTLFRVALDQILRQFSYRHTSATVNAAVGDHDQPWDANTSGAVAVGPSSEGAAPLLSPDPARLDTWVREAVEAEGFTFVENARQLLRQDIAGPSDTIDFAWTVQGEILWRGGRALTHLETSTNAETERLHYQGAVERGRRELRADAFTVTVQAVDSEVFLNVTNNGPNAGFGGQLTEASGIQRQLPTPITLRWRDIELRGFDPSRKRDTLAPPRDRQVPRGAGKHEEPWSVDLPRRRQLCWYPNGRRQSNRGSARE